MNSVEILNEADVSIESITQLFKRAFMKTEIDGDGDLRVFTDGPRVIVTVDDEKKLIRFMSAYGFKSGIMLSAKHALCNKINDEIIFVRFSVPQKHDSALVADYYIDYEEGISSAHIVFSLRRFSRVVAGAVGSCDENNLIE